VRGLPIGHDLFECGFGLRGIIFAQINPLPVDGRASYAWSISEDKLLKVFKKLGVPKECWHEQEVLSPNKLKNLTWEAKDGTPEGLTSEQIELIYREYVKRVPGYPTVVPSNDRRKTREFTLSEDLSNLFKQANNKE
jgi:hypothetical protein